MIDIFYDLADAISGCSGRTCRECYNHFGLDQTCAMDRYYEKAKREYARKTNDWIEFKNNYPVAAAFLHGKFYCCGHNCTDCKQLAVVDSCPADMSAETQEELKTVGYNISMTDLEEILCQ